MTNSIATNATLKGVFSVFLSFLSIRDEGFAMPSAHNEVTTSGNMAHSL